LRFFSMQISFLMPYLVTKLNLSMNKRFENESLKKSILNIILFARSHRILLVKTSEKSFYNQRY